MSKKRKNPEVIDLSGGTSSSEADDDNDDAELLPQHDSAGDTARTSSSGLAATAKASATIDLTGGDEDADEDGDDEDYKADPAELRVGPDHHASDDGASTPEPAPRWDIVLLVDSQEPSEYYEALRTAGVPCERRRLVTFDFLWIARNQQHQEEWVLNHGFERKRIDDLVESLNARENDMARHILQKLKMKHSGVPHRHYMVQGKIGDLYRSHLRPDQLMPKRVHKNVKDLEEEGFLIHRFPRMDSVEQVVEVLKAHHQEMERTFAAATDPIKTDPYIPFEVMTERVKWVTKVVAARKALPKPSLGEIKLQRILDEFPTSFESEYRRDSAGMVQRLSSLKTAGNRRIMQLENARAYCEKLFGGDKRPTATTAAAKTHAGHAASTAVTPHHKTPAKKARATTTTARAATVKRRLFPK